MRRLLPRGSKRKTWILLCCVCAVFGFLQLNNFIYEYQQGSKSPGDQALQLILEKNTTKYGGHALIVEPNKPLLQLVTKTPQADVLVTEKHHEIMNNIQEPLGSSGFRLNFSIEFALQYGYFKDKRGFLTIAIPSVKREGFVYIHNTIDSIIANTSPDDKNDVTVVIMFSDDDDDWNHQMALNISHMYEDHVNSGLIQILVLPHQSYPDFRLLPRTYNDSLERLKWRSKQNVHYAFLFRYCYNISYYYLHLEDDVVTAKNFVSDIRKYKRIRMNDWFLIRFSNMGFIGIFFRSTDLVTVSDFYLLFFAVQPCDFLMNLIAKIKLQNKEIRFRPSLFQHQGIISSLKNKKQVIVDRTFKGKKIIRRKKYYTINPPAEVDTSMVAYELYTATHAYIVSDLYFWAVSPQKGQTYTIVLKDKISLTALIIVGGYPTKKTDYIKYGEVQVSSLDNCSEWTTLGKLDKGCFDSRKEKEKNITESLKNITCVQLEVTQSQTDWAIISEFALLQGQSLKV